MSLITRAFIGAFGTFAIFTQACTFASITEQPAADSEGDDAGSTSGTSSSGGSTAKNATCSNPQFTKPALSQLTTCGNGKGHCYSASKVPTAPLFGADSCGSGQLCVPDEVLNANGQKLKSCTVSILTKRAAAATSTSFRK